MNILSKSKILGLVCSLGIIISILTPISTVKAQTEIMADEVEIAKAKLITISSSQELTIPGTDTKQVLRTIKARILEGSAKGQELTILDDHLKTKEGDTFYVQITRHGDGTVSYSSSEAYRLNWLFIYLLLFIVLTIVFGGMQGIRGLLSLFASIFVIFYLFLPQLVQGVSPLLVSIIVSGIIIVLGSYVTHGFNRTTSSAVVGMLITVVTTGLLALHAVYVLRLTGLSSEEVVYLNFNTQGAIDLRGLLLGGIMIGLLGILYDVAIGQAIIVEELLRSAPHLHVKKVFERAIRVGREHIGALVNNLALAYVGASLPLLLLFYASSGASVWAIMNREDIATEIIRTLIGSIGLVLAVPITTLLSIIMLRGRVKAHTNDHSSLGHSHHGHLHSHTH